MNFPSKQTFKEIPLKYAVLKPNAKILSLSRALKRPSNGQNYKFAISNNFGIRKYEVGVESVQLALKQAQWRFDCPQPIIKCLYINLRSPTSSKKQNIELYLQHMEVTLGNLNGLILPEAVFIILESLKAYKVLQERYGRVDVNHDCVGICSNGQIGVWISRFHEKEVCESQYIENVGDIIKQIVQIVKNRSERVCQAFLGKIEDFILKIKPKWNEMFIFLRKFININEIKLPVHLKYLLYQYRINNDFCGIKMMKISFNEQQNIKYQNQSNMVVKNQRGFQFLPKKIRNRTNSYAVQYCNPKNVKTFRKFSAIAPSINIRPKIEKNQKIKTSHSIKPKFSEKKLSYQTSLKQSFQFKNNIKLLTQIEKSPTSRHGHSLRYKSQSFDTIMTYNSLRPEKNYPAQDFKRCSGITCHTKSGNSYIKHSNHSKSSNFSIQAQTNRKNRIKSSYCLDTFGLKEGLFSRDTSPIFQGEQNENIQSISGRRSAEPTFKCIPQAIGQDAIREEDMQSTDWIKTFKNLMNSGDELNVSINDGQQINAYLSDIRLPRLDNLSRQMVISQIPQNQTQQLSQLCSVILK